MTSIRDYDTSLDEVIEYLHTICDELVSDEIVKLTIKPWKPEAQHFTSALNYLMDLKNIRIRMIEMFPDIKQSE